MVSFPMPCKIPSSKSEKVEDNSSKSEGISREELYKVVKGTKQNLVTQNHLMEQIVKTLMVVTWLQKTSAFCSIYTKT